MSKFCLGVFTSVISLALTASNTFAESKLPNVFDSVIFPCTTCLEQVGYGSKGVLTFDKLGEKFCIQNAYDILEKETKSYNKCQKKNASIKKKIKTAKKKGKKLKIKKKKCGKDRSSEKGYIELQIAGQNSCNLLSGGSLTYDSPDGEIPVDFQTEDPIIEPPAEKLSTEYQCVAAYYELKCHLHLIASEHPSGSLVCGQILHQNLGGHSDEDVALVFANGSAADAVIATTSAGIEDFLSQLSTWAINAAQLAIAGVYPPPFDSNFSVGFSPKGLGGISFTGSLESALVKLFQSAGDDLQSNTIPLYSKYNFAKIPNTISAYESVIPQALNFMNEGNWDNALIDHCYKVLVK